MPVTEIGRVVAGDGAPRFVGADGAAAHFAARLVQPFLSRSGIVAHGRQNRARPRLRAGRSGAPRHARVHAALHRRFPTIAHLRAHARRARAALSHSNTWMAAPGADTGIAHNWAALDAVELVPRYGVTSGLAAGRRRHCSAGRYAAPIGIAPMGGPSSSGPAPTSIWRAAAQRRACPIRSALVGGMTIEQAAEIAPDVFWFQLYRFAKNDHAVGFDLVRRADAAGAHVLMLTLDVPVRTTRSREVAAGIAYAVPAGSAHGGSALRARPATCCRCCARPAALRQSPALCRRKRIGSNDMARLRCRARCAAPSPGTRLRAIATAGSGRWW